MKSDWSNPGTNIIEDLENAIKETKETGRFCSEMRFPNEKYRDEFIKGYCYLCKSDKCLDKTCSFYKYNPYVKG